MKKSICLSVLIAIALAFTLTGCRLWDIFNTITANDTDTITSEQELAFAQQYLEDNYDGVFVYKAVKKRFETQFKNAYGISIADAIKQECKLEG